MFLNDEAIATYSSISEKKNLRREAISIQSTYLIMTYTVSEMQM